MLYVCVCVCEMSEREEGKEREQGQSVSNCVSCTWDSFQCTTKIHSLFPVPWLDGGSFLTHWTTLLQSFAFFFFILNYTITESSRAEDPGSNRGLEMLQTNKKKRVRRTSANHRKTALQ